MKKFYKEQADNGTSSSQQERALLLQLLWDL